MRNKQNRVDFLSKLLIFCTAAFSFSLFFIIAEILFEFSKTTRTISSILYLFLFAGVGGWMVLLPFLKWIGLLSSRQDNEIAKHVGDSFPTIRDRLVNALQLAKNISTASGLYSPELIDKSLKDFGEEIQPLDFTRSVSTAQIPKWHFRFIASGTILFFFFLIFPNSFSDASNKLIHFTREFASPQKFAFEIIPGNKEIVKGENADISVRVRALVPIFTPSKELTILHRQEGQENYDENKLIADSNNLFRATLHTLRRTTEYFARITDAESEHYTLTVLDRPLIRSFYVRLDYPPYTKLASKIQDDFIGDVTALAGTRITVTGSSSKLLKEGIIQFGNNNKQPLSVDGDKFSASFQIKNDDWYYISITDREELSSIDPVHFKLKAVQDEYPSIAIIEPGRNIDIAGDQSLPLLLSARDDFGFTSLRIGYRLIKSRYEQPHNEYTYVQIPLPQPEESQFELNYIWNLKSLDLVPEDVAEYFAEIFDNDILNGPKSGRSNTYLLRLPSLEEVFADVDKEQETSLDNLKQSFEEAKKLKDEIESINRDLKKNKDPDWQTKKKVDEIAKRYQEMQKKIDEVQSKLEQTTQKAQEQNILSKETLEKYLELQQLFQQMDSAELQQALKQLQQQMPNISKEQLQQAMQKMTFSEEQFRQSIERTMNLLKRIHIEQKMDEVKKRAEELEKSEKELKEEGGKSSDDSQKRQEIAEKQSDLAKNEQAMEKEAADLQRRMEEFFTEMPADKLQKSLEQLSKQQLDKKMQQASQQMQSGNMQQAQQMQQQIGEQLQQFSQQMNAMQQEMLQQQSQYVMNEMRKATNNILELSKNEEALKQGSANSPENSPQLRQNAEDQQRAIQDLGNVIKGLSELSQKSFAVTPEMSKSIGEALSQMNEAMRALDMRNGLYASREQEQAMSALNKTAEQVQNALQAMMQGGSSGAGSLMQQLRMMAGRQMSINMQTQQMGGLSQQQAAEAGRLAKEQAAVQKSLEELNREAQQSSGQQKLLGDLQKIADEMKEVVNNLEQNNVNPETLKKQERILSRLLDASKSMRERDYEKRRKAETGTQVARKSPNDLDPNTLEGKDKLREALLKAMEQGYSKDYQELIRKYFEELEKTDNSGN